MAWSYIGKRVVDNVSEDFEVRSNQAKLEYQVRDQILDGSMASSPKICWHSKACEGTNVGFDVKPWSSDWYSFIASTTGKAACLLVNEAMNEFEGNGEACKGHMSRLST